MKLTMTLDVIAILLSFIGSSSFFKLVFFSSTHFNSNDTPSSPSDSSPCSLSSSNDELFSRPTISALTPSSPSAFLDNHSTLRVLFLSNAVPNSTPPLLSILQPLRYSVSLSST